MVKIVQVVQVSRWSAFMICIQKIVCVSFVVWHPDITNPFEYGKLFHNKSFPKRIGTSTPQNLKIFGGGACDNMYLKR